MFNEKYAYALHAFEEFWERKPRKRFVLNIPVTGDSAYRPHKSLHEKWLDEDYILNKAIYDCENTYYSAESIPFLFHNLGPGSLAACIGGSYELAEHTVWFDQIPLISNWDNIPEFSFDENSEMWQHIIRMKRKFLTEGRVNTSMSDLGGIMDVVASLRGTENLLYDLYDYPEEVKEFTKIVTGLWLEAFDREIDIIRQSGQPYNAWMNIPSSKPWHPIQSDFCALISPSAFEEFILPHLIVQSEHMERCIYHLDGPGELPHLDMILDIPGITGIQWEAGAGQPSLFDEQWYPVYKKIQDKKKNLVILSSRPEDNEYIEKLVKTLDPTGVYISMEMHSKHAADNLLENIEKWTS
ncbi:MAG: hypothetical protein E7414_01890 [Ruminococcaceae bacterium]|nr:hypothetical protein [Oscillospiraceae bacterium]